MKKKYEKDLWFVRWEQKDDYIRNLNFNVGGILTKKPFNNEIRIWCTENFKTFSEGVASRAIAGGGWFLKEIRILGDAKNRNGKPYTIPIIEIVIKRTDANYDRKLEDEN